MLARQAANGIFDRLPQHPGRVCAAAVQRNLEAAPGLLGTTDVGVGVLLCAAPGRVRAAGGFAAAEGVVRAVGGDGEGPTAIERAGVVALDVVWSPHRTLQGAGSAIREAEQAADRESHDAPECEFGSHDV